MLTRLSLLPIRFKDADDAIVIVTPSFFFLVFDSDGPAAWLGRRDETQSSPSNVCVCVDESFDFLLPPL